ncbi:low molecular weight protein-tyrosine-phosphatase [Aeromicrobium sp. CF4.19]|uniref:low molecular weight protein-tyrosine-phosphatase n=1 Tax=Aeromicrobium sp. CF4.19 TaxID=3373082 RepID=UPI003EE5F584
MSEPYRIGLVCLGNICRSPMAHVVLEDRLRSAGLDGEVEVTSAGTGGWHRGEPMDPRAATTLSAAGYDPSRHRARTFDRDWYADHDLLLAMDAANHADMAEAAPTVDEQRQLRMFRSFDPVATEGDQEVPDPWYGSEDGFEEVLTMIERTVDAIVQQVDGLRTDRDR